MLCHVRRASTTMATAQNSSNGCVHWSGAGQGQVRDDQPGLVWGALCTNEINRKRTRSCYLLDLPATLQPTPCAIKTIFTARIDALALERQIKIMACLNHPSTVRLLAWIEIPEKVGLVLELCAGDLRSFYSGRLDHVVQSKYSDEAGLTAAMSIVNGMACKYKIICAQLASHSSDDGFIKTCTPWESSTAT